MKKLVALFGLGMMLVVAIGIAQGHPGFKEGGELPGNLTSCRDCHCNVNAPHYFPEMCEAPGAD